MQFSKSSIGYLHIQNGKPCQDFSSSYKDEERSILTVCDGHGGELYVRSHLGGKFASISALRVLSQISKEQLYGQKLNQTLENIKLRILCEWNSLVEEHLKNNPLRKSEIAKFDDAQILRLKNNKIKAYGSTLCAVLVINNKAICVSVGDSSLFAIKKGVCLPVFEEIDDEQVGNITYSLCDENAYEHIKIGIIELKGVDGLLLCTDGVINPYQNLDNFNHSFVVPTLRKLKNEKINEVEDFIEKLGKNLGIGDDVSLAVWIKK